MNRRDLTSDVPEIIAENDRMNAFLKAKCFECFWGEFICFLQVAEERWR